MEACLAQEVMPPAEVPSEGIVLRTKDEKCSAVVMLRDNAYCDAEGRPSVKPDVRLEGGLRPASDLCFDAL